MIVDIQCTCAKQMASSACYNGLQRPLLLNHGIWKRVMAVAEAHIQRLELVQHKLIMWLAANFNSPCQSLGYE